MVLEDLNIEEVKKMVVDGLNAGEINDGIWSGLNDGSLEVPGFVYYDENGIYKKVKQMGYPKIETELSEEESEEFQWAWDTRVESFIRYLQEKYGEVVIGGRSGGYWGLKLNKISDLITAKIDKDVLDKLCADVIDKVNDSPYSYDETDVANSIWDEINYDPASYIHLEPTEKLNNFSKDIDEEAARWEAMDFTQFVSLM